MRLLVNDPFQNQAAIELGAEYVDLDTLFREVRCDQFALPSVWKLPPANSESFAKMKKR